MMDFPQTLPPLLERIGKYFGKVELVSRRPDRSLARTTYGEFYKRSKRLAAALTRVGLKRGDRVATLMWNHATHLEAYFGVPAAGGVLHPLNIRLNPAELAYIVNQAEDRILIVDDVLLPLYEKFRDKTNIERVIVAPMTGQSVPDGYEHYADFVKLATDEYQYPAIDENDTAVLCFTSGTTGRPKGVLYSHRAIVLHTICGALQDHHNVTQSDCVLPAVAMFHMMAWGLPYTAAVTGAKMVLPGRYFDAASLLELLERERVTRAAGATTIWMGVLELLDSEPGRWKLQPGLRVISGGSAMPKQLIRGMERHGIFIFHGWGMTETGPNAAMCQLKSYMREWLEEEQYTIRAKNGLPSPRIELRIMCEGGPAPWDGETMGELQVRSRSAVHGSSAAITTSRNNRTNDGRMTAGFAPGMWRTSIPRATFRSSIAPKI
jgi:fatty-acyl-CoA synthase